mgnify:CR=1 FL=1
MMVGNPADIVVADLLAKGLHDFDVAALFDVLYYVSQEPNHKPKIC